MQMCVGMCTVKPHISNVTRQVVIQLRVRSAPCHLGLLTPYVFHLSLHRFSHP